jgi:hypothetical protein
VGYTSEELDVEQCYNDEVEESGMGIDAFFFVDVNQNGFGRTMNSS